MTHDHDGGRHTHDTHRHDHVGDAPARRIAIALGLTLAFMGLEVVAGVASRSLALLSDAGHMLADAGALALALVAQRVAARPRTAHRTYGFRRAETLAVFVNGIVLGVSAVWVIVEAVRRWAAPPDVKGGWMLVVATAGLAVNLLAAWVLARGRGGHNENTRAALAHVLSDAAGSVAAMAAGGLVLVLGWRRADPAISLLLSLLILWAAWKLVARATSVLMEGAPAGLAMEDVERTIRATPGVADLHDLHVWTVVEGFPVVTVHVVLDGTRHGPDASRDVAQRIEGAHGIAHVTVQAEAPRAGLLSPAALVRPRG